MIAAMVLHWEGKVTNACTISGGHTTVVAPGNSVCEQCSRLAGGTCNMQCSNKEQGVSIHSGCWQLLLQLQLQSTQCICALHNVYNVAISELKQVNALCECRIDMIRLPAGPYTWHRAWQGRADTKRRWKRTHPSTAA